MLTYYLQISNARVIPSNMRIDKLRFFYLQETSSVGKIFGSTFAGISFSCLRVNDFQTLKKILTLSLLFFWESNQNKLKSSLTCDGVNATLEAVPETCFLTEVVPPQTCCFCKFFCKVFEIRTLVFSSTWAVRILPVPDLPMVPRVYPKSSW